MLNLPVNASLLKKSSVHIILIALLGLLVYSNTFNAPFQWDEHTFIEGNPLIKDLNYFLTPSKAKGHEFYDALRRKYVGYLSFALNYKIHGFDVRGWHVFNIAIHILNAILVYLLIILTFRTPFLNPPNSPLTKGGIRGVIALFSALLFVSHPIQTEAVTYIFQRFVPLSALFCLLSMVFYIRWRLTPPLPPFTKGGMGGLLYLLSLISAILAMKTKENSFTLPIAIMLYEFLFFKGSVWKRILYLAPFLLTMLIIPLSLIGIDKPVGEIIEAVDSVTGIRAESRVYLYTEFRVIVTYIRLLFFPVNQNIYYDYPIYHSFLNLEVVLSFVFLLFIFAFSVYLIVSSRLGNPDKRLIGFGILWFFIALSVESSIISLPMVINEYRLYLPSAGAFCAIASAAFLLVEKLGGRKIRIVALSFISLIVLLLSYAGYARNSVWGTKISLWEDTVRKSPRKVMAHNILALAYNSEGMTDKAIEHFNATLRLEPTYTEAHNNLGMAYASKGLISNAVEHFNTALRLLPDFVEAHNNLGNAYASEGRLDEAIRHYQNALRLKPDYVMAHFNLGLAYKAKGLIENSIEQFETAIRQVPDAMVHNELGIVYAQKGLTDKAMEHFKEALRIDPELAKARYNLGLLYVKVGDIDNARKELETALWIEPDYHDARKLLNAIK